MNADAVVRSFGVFLAAAWHEANRLLGSVENQPDLMTDWTQANWEILVEAVLLPSNAESLEVYADGADCNGASSRVFQPDAQPTHRIRCLPREGDLLKDVGTGRLVNPTEAVFWGFVHSEGTTYEHRPPFNAVLLEAAEVVVARTEELTFNLEKLD